MEFCPTSPSQLLVADDRGNVAIIDPYQELGPGLNQIHNSIRKCLFYLGLTVLNFKNFHNRFDFSFFVSCRVISSSLVVEVSELKFVSSDPILDRL